MPEAESEPTCPLCSKPIRAGMGTARVGRVVAHLRCLARQTGLRSLELEERAAELVRRARRATAESARLRTEGTPVALTGRLTAFDAATRRVKVGVIDLTVPDDVPLGDLRLGMSVVVAGRRVGECLVATTITIRPPGWT